MNREEAIHYLESSGFSEEQINTIEQALKKEPCEMTAEEYRRRMIQAFHNADTGELIAVCVFPTEKEFEFLEWLLKNHYKKEPCGDAISRQDAIDAMAKWDWQELYLPIHFKQLLEELPSVSTIPNRCEDTISRQAVLDGLGKYHDGADLHIDGLTYAYDLVCKLPSVSTEKLDKAKSEIRCGENKAYNADFTMGCEYAISVIERMLEGAEE